MIKIRLFQKIKNLFTWIKTQKPVVTTGDKAEAGLPEATIDWAKLEREITGHLANLDDLLKREAWDGFLKYMAEHLPKKASLLCCRRQPCDFVSAGQLGKMPDRIKIIFKRVYLRLVKLIENEGNMDQKIRLLKYKRRLLEQWYEFSPDLDGSLKRELAEHIISDRDESPRWLNFCLSQLHRITMEIPPDFLKKIQEVTSIELTENAHEGTELSLHEVGTMTAKCIANTQLAMMHDKRYGFAHLNLARYSIKNNKHLEGYLKNNEQGDTVDEYMEWQVEQAMNTGVKLSDTDIVIAAYVRFIKKDYHGVIDALDRLQTEDDDEDIGTKHLQILAIANARLWLEGDKKGNVEKAAKYFARLKLRTQLRANNSFLFCRVLAGLDRMDEARAEFSGIDMSLLEADKEDVVGLARILGEFSSIEPLLRSALEEEPESVTLLSLLCELCRFYMNRLGESVEFIKRLAKHSRSHPWVTVKRILDRIDENRLDAASNLISSLPDENIFRQEALLARAIIALKKNSPAEAKQFLYGFLFTDRVDFAYLTAVIHAHEGKYQEAYELIADLNFDEYTKNRIMNLRGRLLLSLGRYGKAADVLEKVTNEDALEYRAWAYLNLEKYDKVLETVKGIENNDGLYIEALARDLNGDTAAASDAYKRFVRSADEMNPYMKEAVDRYCYLVIQDDKDNEAKWLLGSRKAIKFISRERQVHLNAVCGLWEETVALIESGETVYADHNLIVACQHILSEQIRAKKWGDTRKTLKHLENAHESVETYEKNIAREELLDGIEEKPDREIDYKRYSNIEDGAVQLGLAFHRMLMGIDREDAVFRIYDDASDDEKQRTDTLLLMLALAVISKENAKSAEFAAGLLDRMDNIEDNRIKTIAKAFIAVSDNGNHVPSADELLQSRQGFSKILPVTEASFWNKIVALTAGSNIQAACDILDRIANDVEIDQEIRSAVYAGAALENIRNSREHLAITELEKAVEGMGRS